MKRNMLVFARVAGASLLAAAISCGSAPAGETDAIQQDALLQMNCAPGFDMFVGAPLAGTLPFVPLTSLKAVDNPVVPIDPKTGAPTLRVDLVNYISDLNAAIQLGKAFFWEMQAGSDNKVACATCHFQGGGDIRTKNQLSPGYNGSFDALSANYDLAASDFPFVDPLLGRDSDNIVGSQGVRSTVFNGISATRRRASPNGAAATNAGCTDTRNEGPERKASGLLAGTLRTESAGRCALETDGRELQR